jgi:NAD(P)H dehydrogenase (quinone)
MSKIAIIYHSMYGHTKLQAESAVSRRAKRPLYHQPALHCGRSCRPPRRIGRGDTTIFGCPTYMGNMSAGMKSFVEVAARKWFTLAWKNKVAGAITNSSSFSGDKLNTLVGLVINAMQQRIPASGS